jgi:hypothetical protein
MLQWENLDDCLSCFFFGPNCHIASKQFWPINFNSMTIIIRNSYLTPPINIFFIYT